jgi:hypothetical protein
MNILLICGAVLSAIAAVAHVGCIVYGASWYRFFGAGEQMAIWAEQGNIRSTIITSFIVIVLSTWSVYAISGAGLIGRMPLLKLGICVITGIYLLRGVGGFFLITNPMGRSPEFWIFSSIICLTVGLIHLFGLKQSWAYLG